MGVPSFEGSENIDSRWSPSSARLLSSNRTATRSHTDHTDLSDTRGEAGSVTIPYDYLVYAVGCENQTFGIKGVNEHACFLKELHDADKIRTRLMDAIETAAFKGMPDAEIDRLMHMVVVGGGPTGVEYAGELHDFLIVRILTHTSGRPGNPRPRRR